MSSAYGLHARAIVLISEAALPLPHNQAEKRISPFVPQLRRFHGTVVIDTERVGRDTGRIAEEIISHLAVKTGAHVRITLMIDADLPSGAADGLVSTVTENARTLKFTSYGFKWE